MIIWSRLGILALILPIVISFLAQRLMELTVDEPVRPANSSRALLESATDDDIEQLKAEQERKRLAAVVEYDRQVARAKNLGFGIGCIVSAVVLWPFGRWMNKPNVSTSIDSKGQVYETHEGGGHTLFFIPMQYWSIFWFGLGVYNLIK